MTICPTSEVIRAGSFVSASFVTCSLGSSSFCKIVVSLPNSSFCESDAIVSCFTSIWESLAFTSSWVFSSSFIVVTICPTGEVIRGGSFVSASFVLWSLGSSLLCDIASLVSVSLLNSACCKSDATVPSNTSVLESVSFTSSRLLSFLSSVVAICSTSDVVRAGSPVLASFPSCCIGSSSVCKLVLPVSTSLFNSAFWESDAVVSCFPSSCKSLSFTSSSLVSSFFVAMTICPTSDVIRAGSFVSTSFVPCCLGSSFFCDKASLSVSLLNSASCESDVSILGSLSFTSSSFLSSFSAVVTICPTIDVIWDGPLVSASLITCCLGSSSFCDFTSLSSASFFVSLTICTAIDVIFVGSSWAGGFPFGITILLVSTCKLLSSICDSGSLISLGLVSSPSAPVKILSDTDVIDAKAFDSATLFSSCPSGKPITLVSICLLISCVCGSGASSSSVLCIWFIDDSVAFIWSSLVGSPFAALTGSTDVITLCTAIVLATSTFAASTAVWSSRSSTVFTFFWYTCSSTDNSDISSFGNPSAFSFFIRSVPSVSSTFFCSFFNESLPSSFILFGGFSSVEDCASVAPSPIKGAFIAVIILLSFSWFPAFPPSCNPVLSLFISSSGLSAGPSCPPKVLSGNWGHFSFSTLGCSWAGESIVCFSFSICSSLPDAMALTSSDPCSSTGKEVACDLSWTVLPFSSSVGAAFSLPVSSSSLDTSSGESWKW